MLQRTLTMLCHIASSVTICERGTSIMFLFYVLSLPQPPAIFGYSWTLAAAITLKCFQAMLFDRTKFLSYYTIQPSVREDI